MNLFASDQEVIWQLDRICSQINGGSIFCIKDLTEDGSTSVLKIKLSLNNSKSSSVSSLSRTELTHTCGCSNTDCRNSSSCIFYCLTQNTNLNRSIRIRCIVNIELRSRVTKTNSSKSNLCSCSIRLS